MSLLQKIFMTERRKGMFSSLLLLIIASWLAYDAFDSFFPLSEPIFQSSIALVLGVVLVERIFTTPNSAISNSISCLIFSLMLLDEPNYPRGLWSGLALLCALALITSIIGNLQYDNKSGRIEKPTEKVIYFCYRLSSFVGSAGFLWALGLLGSLILLIESIDPHLLFWYPTFALVTLGFPSFLDRMTKVLREKSALPTGAVIASISPSCLDVAFSRAENMRVGDLVLIKEDCRFCNSKHAVDIYGEVVNLSSSGFDEFNVYTGEVLILGAWHEQTECTSWRPGPLGLLQVQSLLPVGIQVFPISNVASLPACVQRLAEDNEIHECLGYVMEKASINELRFQKIPDVNVERGDVVTVWIPGNEYTPGNEGGADVYYQIRDIITEIEDESNPAYEMQRAVCDQIGFLVEDSNFELWDATPYVRLPVFRAKKHIEDDPSGRLGVLPGSEIPIQIDCNAAISYHTAILGTTGGGKTTLLKTIIGKLLLDGKRLVVIDVHDDYSSEKVGHNCIELSFGDVGIQNAITEFLDSEDCSRLLNQFPEKYKEDEIPSVHKSIRDSISNNELMAYWQVANRIARLSGSTKIQRVEKPLLHEFLFKWYPNEVLAERFDKSKFPAEWQELNCMQILSDWLTADAKSHPLAIVIKVHRLGVPEQQHVVRNIAETIHNFGQACGQTGIDPKTFDPIARVGLVLEEAQNFIPQSGQYTPGGDDTKHIRDLCRGAITAIALGGRKYGIGLLLSSQRSAFLSKGVLSQCNSLLALRTVNDNDKKVLLDFVDKSYLPVVTYLGNPPDRPQAIFMGSASSSKTPIIIQYDLPPEFQKGVGSNPARSKESRKKNKRTVKPQD